MPYNGAGVYSPPAADFPAVAGTLIQALKFNNIMNDVATGLSTAITKDGQTTVTANIPFGGFYATNVGIRAIDGVVGTPGISFNNEASMGFYRIAANNLGLSVAGVKKWDILTTSVTLSQDLLFTDATYDIGKAAATRPRDFFLSRNATIGGAASITGLLAIADGAAGISTMGIYFTNDTNTGIYRSGADTVRLVAGGINQISYDASTVLTAGRTTIGAALYVTGQGRFGGWFTGGDTAGIAAEVGSTGGEAYFIGYNRTASAYVGVHFAGSPMYFEANGVEAARITVDGLGIFCVPGSTFALDLVRSGNGSIIGGRFANSSNTAGSTAYFQIGVAGGLAGDPFITFDIAGAQDWSIGADNSVSDNFVIAASGALGSSNVLSITTGGTATFVGTIATTGGAGGQSIQIPATGRIYLDGGGDTYIYEASANNINFTAGGTAGSLAISATGTAIPATAKLYLDGGGDTYLYESVANTIRIVTGGNLALIIDANSELSMTATKRLYLDGGGDTYIHESAANILDMFAGGVNSLRVTASGVIGITKTQTEQATTSGTSIDFTGIPSGVMEVIVLFDQVSTSGTDFWLVQIGDSGGIEVAGYVGAGSNLAAGVGTTASSAGFLIRESGATEVWSGAVHLYRQDTSNTWCASGVLGCSNNLTATVGGSKQLSAELDRVRITTTGGVNTFDLGAANILYRW